MSPRLEQLKHWLHDELGLPNGGLYPASSDASFRRYFRLQQPHGTFIVMDAPPEHEDIIPFIRINQMLIRHEAHVPHIFASSIEQGFILLEDFGSTPYLDQLRQGKANILYNAAIKALIHLQTCPTQDLPFYTETLLLNEMRLFHLWYLERHLGLRLSPDEHTLLETTYRQLAHRALEQKQVFVHRDYHSRNLMVTEERFPGILDFQDAVRGPLTYDLISLLRDSYIEWPEDQVWQWATQYYHLARSEGLIEVDMKTFKIDFDWMSAQRHLKVAGIFARLHHRDGKSGYLKHIPLTLRNLSKAMRPYPQFAHFLHWLRKRLKGWPA